MSLVITAGHLWLVPILGLILGAPSEQSSLSASDYDLEPCPRPGYRPTPGGTPLPAHCLTNTTAGIRHTRAPGWMDLLVQPIRWPRQGPGSQESFDTDEQPPPPLYGTSLMAGKAFDLPDRCGQAPINRLRVDSDDVSMYVVNGQDQEYGEFPSYVKLEVAWGSLMQSYCGGTLISDRHVLTASHCLYHDDKRARASQITIVLGEHRMRARDTYETRARISRVCLSPKYNVKAYESTHDWALLEIAEPVEFNRHVQPACLPREPIETRGRPATCFLVGLGAVGFGPSPGWNGELPSIDAKVVQKLRVEQVSCRTWRIPESDASRSCYTRANGQPGDSCRGDSGGPVLCLDKRGRWTVTAAVSYGTKYCNNDGPAAWIGVYANIQKLVGDMEQHCG